MEEDLVGFLDTLATALLPAVAVEEVAIRAGPWVWLSADLLVRKTKTRMLVTVGGHAVHSENSGESDHSHGELLPSSDFFSGIGSATAHHTTRDHNWSRSTNNLTEHI